MGDGTAGRFIVFPSPTLFPKVGRVKHGAVTLLQFGKAADFRPFFCIDQKYVTWVTDL